MDSEKVIHGFFSQMQKDSMKNFKYDDNMKHSISSIYLNENNEEVEITQICSDETSFNKKIYNDYIYVGKVTKWIKSNYA
tara:strand:+ start:1974 stop:2213 length:240 start_codon:yes stop_codon:yes gene_type:complete